MSGSNHDHIGVSLVDYFQAIVELLHEARFGECDSIIVYCTRREETERLSTLLRTSLQYLPPLAGKQEEPEDKNEEEDEKEKGKGKKKGKTKAKKPKKK